MIDHGRVDSGGFATGYHLLLNAVTYMAEELTRLQDAPDLSEDFRQHLRELIEYVEYMQHFSEDYPSAKFGIDCIPDQGDGSL